MADVIPFHGLRYDESKAGPLSDVIAPPYDVISDTMRDELYARSEYNVVRVEYGRDEPGDDPTTNRYTRAKAALDSWIEKGVLRHDAMPAFYLYDHYFEIAAERVRRRGFLGALRVYQEGRGVVRPHERTFPKAKQDRLRLLRITRTNTSPVFGMYEDVKGEVGTALEAWMIRGPARMVADTRVGNERHMLWRLDDRPVTDKLRAALSDKRIYIADGHHRYETARTYLEEEREAGRIEFDVDTPNYVLTYLCALDDPGLRIFGTHRIIRGGAGVLDAAIASSFDSAPSSTDASRDAGIVLVRDGTFTALTVKAGVDLSQMPEVWRPLPVAQAELVIAPARAAGAEIAYEHDRDAAIAAATGGASTLLIRAVDPPTLQRVADARERLPEKTTYFYPKVPAGLVLRPLGD